jgi:hypothetical protein
MQQLATSAFFQPAINWQERYKRELEHEFTIVLGEDFTPVNIYSWKTLGFEHLFSQAFDMLVTLKQYSAAHKESREQIIGYLRKVAYIIFSQEDLYSLQVRPDICRLLPYVFLLNDSEDLENISIELIIDITKDAFISWKSYLLEQDEKMEHSVTNNKELIRYHSDDNACSFSHGGGYFHLLEFFAGNSQGYRANDGGGIGDVKGIFVTIKQSMMGRNNLYANRTPFFWFDMPAVFTGSINKHFLLMPQNAGYEAFLINKHLHSIKDGVLARSPFEVQRILEETPCSLLMSSPYDRTCDENSPKAEALKMVMEHIKQKIEPSNASNCNHQ